MNTDKLTTIVGMILAVMQAGQVAISQIPAGTTMGAKEWLGVGMAVAFAIIGLFTNKQGNVIVTTTPTAPKP